MTFGKTIQQARLALNKEFPNKWKVKDLAEKVHIDPAYITQIENYGKLPSPKLVIKLQSALEVPLLDVYMQERDPELYIALKDYFMKGFKLGINLGKHIPKNLLKKSK